MLPSHAAQEELVKIDQTLKDLGQQYRSNLQDIKLSFKEHKEKYLKGKKRCVKEYESDHNKLLTARHDGGSKCGVMFSPTSPTEAEKVKVKSQDCPYQNDSDTSGECNDIKPLHSNKKLVVILSVILPSDGVYQSIKSEPPIDPYFSHVVTAFAQTNRVAIGYQSQGHLGGEYYQSRGHLGGSHQSGGSKPKASFQGGSYQSGGSRPTASFHRKLYQSHNKQSQVMHQEHSYVTDQSQPTFYLQNVPHQTAGSQPTISTQGATLQSEQGQSAAHYPTSIHTDSHTNDSQTAALSNVQANNVCTETDGRRDSDRSNARGYYDRSQSGSHYNRSGRYQSDEDHYQYHRSRHDRDQ